MKRLTIAQYLALRYLQDQGPSHGLAISQATEYEGGSFYQMLGGLEQRGLVRSRWEDIDPSEAHRPRRRYYQLTDQGRSAVTTTAVQLRNRT